MPYYIKKTTKFFGAEPFTVVVNDYSTKEIAEKALKVFEKTQTFSGTEWQKFFITTDY